MSIYKKIINGLLMPFIVLSSTACASSWDIKTIEGRYNVIRQEKMYVPLPYVNKVKIEARNWFLKNGIKDKNIILPFVSRSPNFNEKYYAPWSKAIKSGKSSWRVSILSNPNVDVVADNYVHSNAYTILDKTTRKLQGTSDKGTVLWEYELHDKSKDISNDKKLNSKPSSSVKDYGRLIFFDSKQIIIDRYTEAGNYYVFLNPKTGKIIHQTPIKMHSYAVFNEDRDTIYSGNHFRFRDILISDVYRYSTSTGQYQLVTTLPDTFNGKPYNLVIKPVLSFFNEKYLVVEFLSSISRGYDGGGYVVIDLTSKEFVYSYYQDDHPPANYFLASKDGDLLIIDREKNSLVHLKFK